MSGTENTTDTAKQPDPAQWIADQLSSLREKVAGHDTALVLHDTGMTELSNDHASLKAIVEQVSGSVSQLFDSHKAMAAELADLKSKAAAGIASVETAAEPVAASLQEDATALVDKVSPIVRDWLEAHFSAVHDKLNQLLQRGRPW